MTTTKLRPAAIVLLAAMALPGATLSAQPQEPNIVVTLSLIHI